MFAYLFDLWFYSIDLFLYPLFIGNATILIIVALEWLLV